MFFDIDCDLNDFKTLYCEWMEDDEDFDDLDNSCADFVDFYIYILSSS